MSANHEQQRVPHVSFRIRDHYDWKTVTSACSLPVPGKCG